MINRLSFGVRTFNDNLLKQINRKHTKNDILKIIACAKEVGFENISIDLIFNLPTQTKEHILKDLDVVKTLDVSHISLYGLILEEKSVLGVKNIEIDYSNYDQYYLMIKEQLELYGY